ncbi:MAG: outer membrane protein assembly factor BamB [Pseudomonadota bacterium]
MHFFDALKASVVAVLLWLPAGVLAAPSRDSTASPDAQSERVPIHTLWTARNGSGFGKHYLKLQLASDQSQIFSADWRGKVTAFDSKSGQERWQTEIDEHITGGLYYRDNTVLLGTDEASLIALNAADGAVRWRQRLSSEILGSPLLERGVVVVQTNDGKVFGLDANSGKTLWTEQRTVPVLTLRGTNSPVAAGNGMVVTGFASGKLVALDIANGSVLWELAVAFPQGRSELKRIVDIDAEALIDQQVVYAVAYHGRLVAVDLAQGRMLWSKDLSSYAGMTFDERFIYVSDADGAVHAIDRQSGVAVWKQDQLGAKLLTKPTVYQNYLVLGDQQGNLYWLDRQTGAKAAQMTLQYVIDHYYGLDLDVWDDYNRSGLPDHYTVVTGLTVPPLSVEDMLVATDNKGRVVAFNLSQEH